MNVRLVNLHPMCENNTHLLTRATRYFERNGHRLVSRRGERADLIVVGGCVVTDGMRARCERRVLELLQAETKAPVIVLGCLGALPERLASGERLQLLGCRDGARLDRLIGAHVPFGEVQAAHLERHLPYLPDLGANNAYVAIAEGCVNACSYCNIKRAKGHVVSRPPEAIEAEVAALRAQGLASVTLLADDCGSYGLDRGLDLAALLLRLAARVPGLNFKVYTVFPALLLAQLPRLEPLFAARRIPYLCVPVQSGAPRVLTLMNRRYDLGRLAAALARLRALDPGLLLDSHFIYNFPGETWAEFEQTIACAGQFDFSVFVRYGENASTPAAGILPKCSDEDGTRKGKHLEELVLGHQLRGFVVTEA